MDETRIAAGMKRRKPTRYIDGWSESLWISAAVKSIRLGWPAGLEECRRHLSRSAMKSTLVCQLFEDVFPTLEELPGCIREIDDEDYECLCRRETHHARGYTHEFVSLWNEDGREAETRSGWLWQRGRELGLVPGLSPRAMGVFFGWLRVNPQDAGVRRDIDASPWRGMPLAFADSHTVEGRKRGQRMTVISGHAEQHFVIAERVAEEGGWAGIRAEVHATLMQPLDRGEGQGPKPTVVQTKMEL